MREISQLMVRMAQENPGWRYTRIQGALANLSHQVGRGSLADKTPSPIAEPEIARIIAALISTIALITRRSLPARRRSVRDCLSF
jgi:hypothetical protein